MTIDKPPLRATVEFGNHEIHFEAMESEEPDGLPSPEDWWIDKIIDTKTQLPFNARQRCDFELANEDAIHWLIHDKCRRIKEASDENYAIRNW